MSHIYAKSEKKKSNYIHWLTYYTNIEINLDVLVLTIKIHFAGDSGAVLRGTEANYSMHLNCDELCCFAFVARVAALIFNHWILKISYPFFTRTSSNCVNSSSTFLVLWHKLSGSRSFTTAGCRHLRLWYLEALKETPNMFQWERERPQISIR